ncbi:MAG: aldehyde dehydrogenase family protein, partial [Phycisphaerales bacterium]|nr:aldehyde dehydrogenase family protein [Phycisphaerales bacterium]
MTTELLNRLGLTNHPRVVMKVTGNESPDADGIAVSMNPATGKPIAGIRLDDAKSYEEVTQRSVEAFKKWRTVPAPKRGEVV